MTGRPLQWFRLYAEAVDDEKLRLLAFEDRWHFVAILCCKAQGLLEGEDADLRMRKVCVKLGLDERELGEVARRLAAVGLIERETYRPLAWDHRQFRSDHDPTAAIRQKKWRENSKLRTVTDASRVTLRTSNGRVTPSETETETEQNQKQRKEQDADKSADVWAYGVELLAKDGGLSERSARSYIGVLCRTWPESTVLEAFMAATGKADPKAYAKGYLDKKPRKGQSRNPGEELMRELQAKGVE